MRRARSPTQENAIPPASIDEVAASIRRVQSVSHAEKEALCDDIFNQQPNLLGHVLVLSKLGVPMDLIQRAGRVS